MTGLTDRRSGRDRVSPVLIGRDDAVDLGLRRWSESSRSRGAMILVAGEAGVGKTRLLSELVTRTGVLQSPVAGAFPRETDAPGSILLNLADDLSRNGFVESARNIRTPLLTDYNIHGDFARKRRILLSELSDALIELLAQSSILLRLEDVHWADELSLEVLEKVAAALPNLPSLVIVSYRNDGMVGLPLRTWRARLLQQRLVEEVRLARLDLDQTGSLVAAILGSIPPSSFVEALHQSSDGIPLHIEELVATGTYSSVLETVADAVLVQFGQLEPVAREIVAAASVIGRSFSFDLLGRVTGLDDDSVRSAVSDARELNLVRSHSDGSGFGFRHSIVCDVIYGSVSASRRAALHSAVAHAATASGIGDAYVSEQFEKSGEGALAYIHAKAAAGEAARIAAHRQSVNLYSRAVRTMPTTVQPRERADVFLALGTELEIVDDISAAATWFTQAIALYRSLGDETSAARAVPRLMSTQYLLGVPLRDRVVLALESLTRLDGTADLGSESARSMLLAALSAAYMLHRRLEDCLDYGLQAQALVDATTDLSLSIDLETTIGAALLFDGRTDDGWRLLESAIYAASDGGLETSAARAYRMIGSSASALVEYSRATDWLNRGLQYTAATEQWNHHYYLRAHLGHVAWAEGDLNGAKEAATRASADGTGITTQITARIVLGYVGLSRAEVEQAHEHLSEALNLAEQLNEVQRISPAIWGLAELAARRGETGLAIDFCQRGLIASEEVTDAAYVFPLVVTGTRAYLDSRDLAGARSWLVRCSALLQLRSIAGTLPALDHARGLIELAEGRTGAARRSLELAQSGWEQSRRFWEGTDVLHDLAACAHRSRRPNDAMNLSSSANARAAAAGAVMLVRSDLPTGHLSNDPLSSREREVANLVTAGLTNREIATALVISPSTVSTHLEHILAKLGVSRRAEIAAWVSATR